MTIRSIVVYDDARLRETSQPVRGINRKLRHLIDDMIETMHEKNGIGLAAIQVGAPERLITIHIPPPEDEEAAEASAAAAVQLAPQDTRLYVVVNPEIVKRSPDVEPGIEGCLSVPGLIGEVERRRSVVIEGLDRWGKPLRIEAEGLLARVFQHEIDHCDGVLFIDHVDDMEKLWTVEEGEEELAEIQFEARQP
jgi:peptide deformylase